MSNHENTKLELTNLKVFRRTLHNSVLKKKGNERTLIKQGPNIHKTDPTMKVGGYVCLP